MDKKLRLIELFAGIGAQARALERIGVPFEHYRCIEFDKKAITSYNRLHGTDFKDQSICDITGADLGVVDCDKYVYIMTYSFPCQDLSNSGKKRGMSRTANNRSSLLWEVERLLTEMEEKPQVLLMENVTAVHNKRNFPNFSEWCQRLEEMGYTNYYADLNSKDYGIPQSRPRCFMVSFLGEQQSLFEFPEPFELTRTWDKIIDPTVRDEEDIGNSDRALMFKNDIMSKGLDDGFYLASCSIYPEILDSGYTRCLLTQNYVIGEWQDGTVAVDIRGNNIKARYLRPVEMWQLMGFSVEDYNKCIAIGAEWLTKQAGNSIVVDVLQYIFESILQHLKDNDDIDII